MADLDWLVVDFFNALSLRRSACVAGFPLKTNNGAAVAFAAKSLKAKG